MDLFITLLIFGGIVMGGGIGYAFMAGVAKGAIDRYNALNGTDFDWSAAWMWPVMLPMFGAYKAIQQGYKFGNLISPGPPSANALMSGDTPGTNGALVLARIGSDHEEEYATVHR